MPPESHVTPLPTSASSRPCASVRPTDPERNAMKRGGLAEPSDGHEHAHPEFGRLVQRRRQLAIVASASGTCSSPGCTYSGL